MKKYISIFSVLIFFIGGLNLIHAQELERRSLDESKGNDKSEVVRKAKEKAKADNNPEVQAKVIELQEQDANDTAAELTQNLREYVTLDKDQSIEVQRVYLDMTLKMEQIGEDDGSDKYQNAVSEIKDQANQKMMKIFTTDEQVEQYNTMLEKLTKSDK